MIDPILDLVELEWPGDFERCIGALMDLGSGASVSLASLERLPVSVWQRLAAHPDPEVRRALASNPMCPGGILRPLASDPDSSVRTQVAANPAIPADLLMSLVTDEKATVRIHADLNENASEEVRAAFVLASTSDEVRMRDARMQEIAPEEDPRTSPTTLAALMEQFRAEPTNADALGALARNPSLPHEVVPQLVESAQTPREWRALWYRGRSPQPGSVWLWPSTYAYLSSETPAWLLQLLSEAGHPASLLTVGGTSSTMGIDPAQAVKELIDSELFTRSLWRELALEEVVTLTYWSSYDRETFFPEREGLHLIEPRTAAELLVGRGHSTEREWASTEPYLSVERACELAVLQFEDFFESDPEWEDEDLQRFSLMGVAFAQDFLNLDVIWTEVGKTALEGILQDHYASYSDPEDFDYAVIVGESRLPKIGFAETSEAQKEFLVKLIQESRSDLMLDYWGIANHLLKCIALHPATPESILDRLRADSDEGVRTAVDKRV